MNTTIRKPFFSVSSSLFLIALSAVLLSACGDVTGTVDTPLIGEDHPAWEAYNTDTFAAVINQGQWHKIEFPSGQNEVWIRRRADQSTPRFFWFHDAGGELAKVSLTAYDLAGNELEDSTAAPIPLHLTDQSDDVFLKATRESGGDVFYLSVQRTDKVDTFDNADIPLGSNNGLYIKNNAQHEVVVVATEIVEWVQSSRTFSFADANNRTDIRDYWETARDADDLETDWATVHVTVMKQDFTSLLSLEARMDETVGQGGNANIGQSGIPANEPVYFIVERKPASTGWGFALIAR